MNLKGQISLLNGVKPGMWVDEPSLIFVWEVLKLNYWRGFSTVDVEAVEELSNWS